MQSTATTASSGATMSGSDKMMAMDSSTNTAMTEHNFTEEKKTRGKTFTKFIKSGDETIDYRPSCNGFKILRTLGKGGNGVVKLVEKDGNEYAMKIFEPHPTEKDHFCQETQAELDLVQEHMIDDIPTYYEFVENAIWQKKDGKNV